MERLSSFHYTFYTLSFFIRLSSRNSQPFLYEKGVSIRSFFVRLSRNNICSVLHFGGSRRDMVVRKARGNPGRSRRAPYINQSRFHIYKKIERSFAPPRETSASVTYKPAWKDESCFASRKINSPTSWKWFNNFLEHNEDLLTCHRAFYMLIKDRLSD